MFRFAEDHSNIAYLQTLHISYEMSKQLMNDLVLLFDRLSIIEGNRGIFRPESQ